MKATSKVTDNIIKIGEVFSIIDSDESTLLKPAIKITNSRVQGLWANKEDFEVVSE